MAATPSRTYAEAPRERGYEYIGISDHSQNLKIARGVSVEDLWAQIKYIDRLNGRLRGFRILKSSEVDILADGSLDYHSDLLRELDYTVCSIHSRFALDPQQQTERLDNVYHAGGHTSASVPMAPLTDVKVQGGNLRYSEQREARS